MHRPSAAGLVLRPAESPHIRFDAHQLRCRLGGTRTRTLGRRSVFNGREPDEDRWDFDFGAFDSVAGRVWFRPASEWEIQVSTGHLSDPEELVEATPRARRRRWRGSARRTMD